MLLLFAEERAEYQQISGDNINIELIDQCLAKTKSTKRQLCRLFDKTNQQ